MKPPIPLTEEMVLALSPDAKSLRAARELADGTACRDLRIGPGGNRVEAQCQGSEPEPYAVKVERERDIVRTGCACFSSKYPCKHALAVLLLLARTPERFVADGSLVAGKKQQLWTGDLKLKQTAPPGPAEVRDEGEALLRAIYEEPEEPAHRLVYADWVDERGESDRAQFIRVQCELQRTPEGPRAEELRRQERRLLDANRKEWLADVPAHLRGKVEFRGGFISHLNFNAQQLLKYGRELCERFPIYSVRFRAEKWTRRAVDKLTVQTFWERVREIQLGFYEALEPLLASPFLKDLRRLTFWTVNVGTRGATALGTWPGLKSLQELDLRKAGINDSAVDRICASGPASLRLLRLIDNAIHTPGAVALADCAALASLRELDLTANQVGAKGAKAIASSPHLAGLRVLDLSSNPITDQGALALAESPTLGGLGALKLHGVKLGEEAVAALRGRFADRVALS